MPNYSTTQCQGWSNPSTTFYGPIILTLSSYYTPAGSTSLVTIYGENFYSYSTVLFATYNPTVYFISSTTLQFYVPSSLYPGDYTIQVFNGSIASNIVTYTLDNSSGYWIINLNNSITNTNKGDINVTNSANIGGKLEVTNESTFNNDATFNASIFVSNAANVGGKLEVINDATFNASIFVSNAANIGSLEVINESTFDNNATFKASIVVSNEATIGSLEVINESTFDDNATFNASISVSNAANVGGKLEVINDATFNKNLILSGTPSSNYIQFPDGSTQFVAYNSLIGEIKMYAGLKLPDGYLWCNGASYNTEDTRYNKLFNAISYAYGGSDDTNTFAVPNLQQKFPIGAKDNTIMTVDYTDSTGAINSLSTGGNQSMEVNQLGQHTHNFTRTGDVNLGPSKFLEDISLATNTSPVDAGNTGGSPDFVHSVNNNQGPTQITVTNNISGNVGNNNYSNSHEDLLPPFTVVNYIICYQ